MSTESLPDVVVVVVDAAAEELEEVAQGGSVGLEAAAVFEEEAGISAPDNAIVKLMFAYFTPPAKRDLFRILVFSSFLPKSCMRKNKVVYTTLVAPSRKRLKYQNDFGRTNQRDVF